MFVAFAALAALATASAATPDLDLVANELIEQFRSIMAVGHPAAGLPVLDPATIDMLPITVKFTPFDAQVTATGVNINGVSGFSFTELKQIAGTDKLSVSVSLPDIPVDGFYVVDGKVKIGFLKFDLDSEGPFTILINDLKGTAIVDVAVNGDGSYNVDDLDITSWTYKKITIQADNLFNGGAMGATVNKLINTALPTFLSANSKKIVSMATEMGLPIINKYLNTVAGKSAAKFAARSLYRSPVALEWVVPAEVELALTQAVMVAGMGRSSGLDAKFMNIAEEFRAILPTGYPAAGIPAYDPAVVPEVNLAVKMSPLTADISASGVRATGVSGFIISKISQIEGTNKVALTVHVPQVDVTGDYRMNGKVKIVFNIKLKEHGSLGVTLQGVTADATLDLIENEDGSLSLDNLNLDSWSYQKLKIKLGNINGVVTSAINSLAPKFITANRDAIEKLVCIEGKKVLNNFLDAKAGKPVAALSTKLAPEPVRTFVLDEDNMIMTSPVRQLVRKLAVALADGQGL